MRNFLKVLVITVLFFSINLLSGCSRNTEDSKFTIVTTSFPSYDFARAIVKDNKEVKVKMLLKPGAEMHDFEPTPKDIKDIKNSDLFIYIGGDSDEWADDLIKDVNIDKDKVVKLMDLVDVVKEEHVEGMEDDDHHEHEEEAEYDEHVWTSPVNAITIINKLKDIIVNIDESNRELYEKNSNDYVSDISKIDNKFRDVVNSANRKEIIFGDRFPLRYFADEYGLSYYAAFPGCSEQTEASAKTISFLINKVREDKVPVVFHIELSSGNIAKQIAKETGVKVLEFNAAHNISQENFDAGITYVDIMSKNAEVLKEAIN